MQKTRQQPDHRPALLAALLAGAAFITAAPAAAQIVVLEDIVVAAERAPTPAAQTGATVATIGRDEIERQARPFALDYLTQLPGVRITRAGPPGQLADTFLRGLPQRYVRVRVDGIEISDPSAPQVQALVSGIPAADIGRIEVLQGSQSALYGGQAVGGVIDITSARPERDGIEHRLSAEAGRYRTVSGAYTLTSRSERSDLALTLQRFQTDGFSAAERRDGNPEPDGYETTRLSGAGAIYPSDDFRLFASGFVQWEDGEQDGFAFVPPAFFAPADADERFRTRTWGARVGADFPLGPVASTVALARFDIDRRVFDPDGSLSFGGRGERRTLEYLGRVALAPNLELGIGADTNREAATFRPSGIRASSRITGAFAQAAWTPFDPLRLNVALRRDEHSQFGGHTTGRLTAALALPSQTVVRGSIGTGFRPPSLNELFGQFGPNPELQPETSLSADLGLEQVFLAGRARASATLFRVEIDDLIDYDFATGYVQSDGTARSQGVELAAAWEPVERLRLTAAYTYTDARTADGARRARVPRHDAVLGAEARLTERLDLAATVERVAGVVDGPPVPGRLDIVGSYTVVNARAAYAVSEEAELYLRAENLLNAQYQTVRGYGTADRAFYFGVRARF